MHSTNEAENEQDQGEPIEELPVTIDLVREQLREAMTESRLSQRAVARELGVNVSAVSTWLAGKYRGNSDTLAGVVAAWLTRRRRESGDGFTKTPTAQRLLNIFEAVRQSGLMGCVYGGAGLGKTKAIEYYCAQHPGRAWNVTIDPSCSAVVPALDVVAESVGAEAQGGALVLRRAICQQVTGSRRGVLIVDEAQHLSLAAVEAIRAIHDRTRIGLVLCGNLHSYKRLAGNGFAAERFAQVNSRIGLREWLHRADPRDVAHLAAHWGVIDRQAIALLQQIATTPGALRSVARVLHWCAKQDGPTTTVSIYAAARVLGAEV